jgi:hypothetical protein
VEQEEVDVARPEPFQALAGGGEHVVVAGVSGRDLRRDPDVLAVDAAVGDGPADLAFVFV